MPGSLEHDVVTTNFSILQRMALGFRIVDSYQLSYFIGCPLTDSIAIILMHWIEIMADLCRAYNLSCC